MMPHQNKIDVRLQSNRPDMEMEPPDKNSIEFKDTLAKVKQMGMPGVWEELNVYHKTPFTSEDTTDERAREILAECIILKERSRQAKWDAYPPTEKSNPSEWARYRNPNLDRYLDRVLSSGDQNRFNCMIEYMDEKDVAIARYGNSKLYQNVFEITQKYLDEKITRSSTILFSGFPSAMDSDAIKQSMEEFGSVTSVDTQIDEDKDIVTGKIIFDDPDDAEKACKKWDGVDMGMGVTLSLKINQLL